MFIIKLKGKNMPNEEEKCKLIEFIEDYKKSEEYKEEEYGEYKFIPLNYQKDPIVGFEVFSTETVDEQKAKEKNIEKTPFKHRYYHYEKLPTQQNNGKHIIYILFNPSKATSKIDDTTVKNCRTLAGKYPESVSEMSIINLFSERTTKPKYIDKNKEVNENNINFINSFINEFKDNDNVIWVKAWGFGKDKDYNDTITRVDLYPKILM